MAISGVGVVFSRKVGLTYVPLAEILSIAGPKITRGVRDTTSLDTTGGYKTFVAGFRDGGEISASMNFSMTSFGILKDSMDLDTLEDFRIVWPDAGASQADFKGLVTGLEMNTPGGDDNVTCDLTIKISGPVTFAS